jgi:glycine/D-amino acid oxidase-like deaminating enzyme
VDLRSGLSYWRAINSPIGPFPALQDDVDCDVAVVGGGITGALVAYYLVRIGVSTILLDKRELGTGSTAASTGLLMYEMDEPLVDLIAKIGEQQAVEAYRCGRQAIHEFEKLVGDLNAPCGFARRPSLYFASTRADVPSLEREYACRREHGFNVELLNAAQLRERSTIDAPAALYSLDDAQVDPLQLTAELLSRAQADGLRIFAHTQVKHRHRVGDSIILQTSGGRVTARSVVLSGGYESVDWVERKLAALRTTYVVTSEPLRSCNGWPDACLIWETAHPYFYARQTLDGRAMIGGEDTSSPQDHEDSDLLQAKVERLQARFRELFPALSFVPAYAWAGTFAESDDGLAYIGTLPGRDKEYFALGYGGNGITFGLIAARLLVDLFLQRPNAAAAVFRFSR